MGAKHTPGPWWVEPEEASEHRGLAICAEDAVVATITPDDSEHFPLDEIDRANANLIAAAPALWTACWDLVQALRLKMGTTAVNLRLELAEAALMEATK